MKFKPILYLTILSLTSCWNSSWTEAERKAFKEKCDSQIYFNIHPIKFTGFEFEEIATIPIVEKDSNKIIDTLFIYPNNQRAAHEIQNQTYSSSPPLKFNKNHSYEFYLGSDAPYILDNMQMIMWPQYTMRGEGYGCVIGNFTIDGEQFEKVGNMHFKKRVGDEHFNSNQTPTLRGHWHLEGIGPNSSFLGTEFLTIDFENDSLATLGKFKGGYGGIEGFHDSKDKTIRFGGEGIMINFEYEIDQEKLMFYEKRHKKEDGIYTAFKCGHLCCDKQVEFFDGLNINIDLPILYEGNCITSEKLSLQSQLYIGRPKENQIDDLGLKHRLSFGNKFAKIEDLELWEEKHKIKVPDSFRDRIYNVVFADKDTPMSLIIPLIDYFKNQPQKQLFVAMRKVNTTEKVNICLIEIDFEKEISINNAMKISDWLKMI